MDRSEIIPVTYEIRKYLNNQPTRIEEDEILYKFGLDIKNNRVIKEIGKIIITNKKEEYQNKKETMENKLIFLKDIAKKMHKSLVWVYQEMVLSGYGECIDKNSDIYQESLLAYEEVSLALTILPKDEERWFEENHILTGNINEKKLIHTKDKEE